MPELLHPPRSVCILRLSALGDCCHVVPIVRTLQQAWPDTKITWVIGQAESALLSLLPGVEFITVSKARPWHAAGALRAAEPAAVAARQPLFDADPRAAAGRLRSRAGPRTAVAVLQCAGAGAAQ
jgi:hypothetical protein